VARQNRIDVHHHVLPQFYRDAQTEGGYPSTAYRAFPDWSAEKSLALMDGLGIATAMMSFSAPGIYFGDRAATADLARRCNDYLADLIASHPGRFGAFASLPFPNVDDCLAEIARCQDQLGLDGFIHLTQTDDRYAGHPENHEVYRELNRRKAVVFIHPTYPSESRERDHLVPRPIVDYPCETTRAVSNMLFTGVLAQMPDIRFILSHAGGVLPILAHRIEIFDDLTAHRQKYPDGARAYFRRLYYDTALSGDAAVLSALQALADPARILFGTDYPYIPERVAEAETAGTDGFAGFDEKSRSMMEYGNALALFPRLDRTPDPPPN
jgi:predicted TIM-barrel fold metal-dependent hydrolase